MKNTKRNNQITIEERGTSLAKFMKITAIIILVGGILMAVATIITFSDKKSATNLLAQGITQTEEISDLRTKISAISFPGSALFLAGLVLSIILWVKQVKLNKQLIQTGKKKYFVYPIVFFAIVAIETLVSTVVQGITFSKRITDITQVSNIITIWGVWSVVITLMLIIFSAFLLKKSTQIRKDFA